MKYQHGVIALLLLALMVACGPAAEDAETAKEVTAEASTLITSEVDRAGIDAAVEKLQTAFSQGDIEMLVSSYTNDVVYMGADSPMGRGGEAMRADNEPLSAYDDNLVNDEVVATGDWGYTLGPRPSPRVKSPPWHMKPGMTR